MYDFTKILLLGHVAKMKNEERGATAVEYGLLVALIAAVIVGVVLTLGGKVKGGFDTVNNTV
jgi:pilus assembly protein Flp/PilA